MRERNLYDTERDASLLNRTPGAASEGQVTDTPKKQLARGWMTPDAASRDWSKLPPTPRLAKPPHQPSNIQNTTAQQLYFSECQNASA
jgi:hypothetical protein